MTTDFVSAKALLPTGHKQTANLMPALFSTVGEQAQYRVIEFFTATIRNPNTRLAYFRAVHNFSRWCEQHEFDLAHINPVIIARYVEEISQERSVPTVKQHLSALKMLFDHLITGHIIPTNPAAAVKPPRYVITQGKTPVLTAEETRLLLDAIKTDTIAGLRDRALIGLMVFSFARVGAVVAMNVEDYFPKGKRYWIRLHEKGGKYHEMPVHHLAEAYMDAYIAAAELTLSKKEPLFRTLNRHRRLTNRRLHRTDVLRLIKKCAQRVGLPAHISCHTFRATGITVYLSNGGSLENAQRMAAHASPRTTKLYDRRSDEISLDEVERIHI